MIGGVGITVEPTRVVVTVPAWVDAAQMPEAVAQRELDEAAAKIHELVPSDEAPAEMFRPPTIPELVDASHGWQYATWTEGVVTFTDAWRRHGAE